MAYVDRLTVPNDTYYVLQIAGRMAKGLPPSTESAIVTNGFQPLIAFLQRYLYFACLAFVLLVSLCTGRVLAKPGISVKKAVVFLLLAGFFLDCMPKCVQLFSEPAVSVNMGLGEVKGYREPVKALLTHLPPGAAVGAFQSGALSYYGVGAYGHQSRRCSERSWPTGHGRHMRWAATSKAANCAISRTGWQMWRT